MATQHEGDDPTPTVFGTKKYGYTLRHLGRLRSLEDALLSQLPDDSIIHQIDMLNNDGTSADVHLTHPVGCKYNIARFEYDTYKGWRFYSWYFYPTE